MACNRIVNDHKLNGANNSLDILVLDEPGQGGANHKYAICYTDIDDSTGHKDWRTELSFQNGPIKEFGVNGITQEVLLAIVIDRLRSFQSGPFACRDNAVALTKCEEALMWLHKRTQDRLRRGVEGVNKQ